MASGRKSSLRNGFQSNRKLQATREGFQLDAWPSWEHNGAAFRTTTRVSWSGGSQQSACSTTIIGNYLCHFNFFFSPDLSSKRGHELLLGVDDSILCNSAVEPWVGKGIASASYESHSWTDQYAPGWTKKPSSSVAADSSALNNLFLDALILFSESKNIAKAAPVIHMAWCFFIFLICNVPQIFIWAICYSPCMLYACSYF